MIGSGLKKLAAEKGMTVAHGVAYGAYQGFALTMSEGNGWKALEFATRFSEPAAADALERKLNEVDMKRTYRVRDLVIGQRSIAVVFLDNPGTMKKIRAFLDWFMPLLEESGATKVNVCNECGCDTLGDDSWVLIDGVAHHMHAAFISCKASVCSLPSARSMDINLPISFASLKGSRWLSRFLSARRPAQILIPSKSPISPISFSW